ncbi:MAG: HAD family hydrolase [Oscillospiraceae bacterium]|nr:HAD family hydrolase [Oscillospiraceae bacterium]
MSFKAIIFDLDGTLLNTLNDIVRSLNEVLKCHGFPIHSFDEYKYFVGNGAKTLIDRAVPKDTESFEKEKMLDEYLKYYGEHQCDDTCVYEGMRELLQDLNEADISISVLSNKPHNSTVQVIDHYYKGIKFDCVYGQRSGIPIKPDKTAAIMISESIHIPPSEIVFVGDSNVDIETAINSGMFPVGALWGFRTKDELLRYGAKKLVLHPKEILDIFCDKEATR